MCWFVVDVKMGQDESKSGKRRCVFVVIEITWNLEREREKKDSFSERDRK